MEHSDHIQNRITNSNTSIPNPTIPQMSSNKYQKQSNRDCPTTHPMKPSSIKQKFHSKKLSMKVVIKKPFHITPLNMTTDQKTESATSYGSTRPTTKMSLPRLVTNFYISSPNTSRSTTNLTRSSTATPLKSVTAAQKTSKVSSRVTTKTSSTNLKKTQTKNFATVE